MIENPKSLLPFLHFDEADSWARLLELCTGFLNADGLDRLQALLSGTVRTVAVEYHYIDRDYRDTFSGFHSKKFSTPASRCIRLHFFRERIEHGRVRAIDEAVRAAYVGYAVIRPTRPNCMGRTLLDPTRIAGVSGALCRCSEKVSLQGAELTVTGFPFISQDGDATVCAESATWMVLRYFSNRYPSYREIHPFQITTATQHHAVGKRVYPSNGLQLWQMAETLRREGFAPMTYSRTGLPESAEFTDLLYTYIESGFPVFAALKGHVVVALGHRSDYGKALPVDQVWIKSSYFNEAFVINDDNRFPYQLVERVPPSDRVPLVSIHGLDDIAAFTVPLPEKVFLSAEAFASLVRQFVLESDFSVKNQSPLLAGRPLLTRHFLTTCKSFKQHLGTRGMGNPLVREIYHNLPLPHFIWICEITTPDLYQAGAQKVLGEIIWDATRNAYEPLGFIAAHYPEKLWVDTGSAFNQPPKFERWELADSASYPVLKSNLLELP